MLDIFGKPDDCSSDYNSDKIQNIFSSGKSVAAILMAIMQDKGHFKYSDKVAHHWPEFAQNGKEHILIADVLRHECGLHKLQKPLDLEWLKTENLKKNMVGEIIESDTPFWLTEEKRKDPFNVDERQYHAVTRDWITNEIFRRVEPNGRTMGEYLRDDQKTFGDIYIGLRDPKLFEQVEELVGVPGK